MPTFGNKDAKEELKEASNIVIPGMNKENTPSNKPLI